MLKKIAKFLKLWLWQWWWIPRGDYCYKSGKWKGHKTCPYWKRISFLHYQENGYCELLKEGDIDRNNDESIVLERIDVKTGEVIEKNTPLQMPFGIGLLWDMCKECGYKPYVDDDFELEIP